MKKIDTVLLDFDGTIMDTNEMIIKSWQHTFQQLRGETVEESVLLATFGEPLKMTMHNFFGGDQEEVEKKCRNLQELSDGKVSRSDPFCFPESTGCWKA